MRREQRHKNSQPSQGRCRCREADDPTSLSTIILVSDKRLYLSSECIGLLSSASRVMQRLSVYDSALLFDCNF